MKIITIINYGVVMIRTCMPVSKTTLSKSISISSGYLTVAREYSCFPVLKSMSSISRRMKGYRGKNLALKFLAIMEVKTSL